MSSERSATFGGSTFASTLARWLLPSQDHGKKRTETGGRRGSFCASAALLSDMRSSSHSLAAGRNVDSDPLTRC